ncbi:MAG: thioredoxin family protein [Desulfobacterales bacterium]|nr:thioredoxin family protein [Desulfobacterales bacterium]
MIGQWATLQHHIIPIHLHLTKDPRSDELEAFCDMMKSCTQNVHLVKDKDNTFDIPAINLGNTITYQGIPQGDKLQPFLQLLSDIGNQDAPMDSQYQLPSEKIPGLLTLFVANQCPYCTVIFKDLSQLALANELIHLTVIDGLFFSELAEKNQVQSVPTLIVSEGMRWVGQFRLKEIMDYLVDRDPIHLSMSSLENIILQGKAIELAEIMIDRQQVFPAIIDLLTHPFFSIRLGAMTIMETIAESHRLIALPIIPSLVDRFDKTTDVIKGDLIYILGEIANKEYVAFIENSKANHENPDIKEACDEAIEKILSHQ